MVKREYTQTVRPVSRIPEKIFGWLAWLTLLAIAGFILYSLLVSGNDPNFMESATSELERQITSNPQIGDFMANNNLTPQEFVHLILKAGWYVLAYMALPLILGLIGLLSMKNRIAAGVLLLLAGLLTLPMFAIFWIPLFFLIAAILLFIRKNKVIRNDDYHDDNRCDTYDRHREAAPVYVDRDESLDRERNDNYEPRTTSQPATEQLADYVDTTGRRNETVEPGTQEHGTVQQESEAYRDRVKYVDKTKDAMIERRENYNNRMNNRD
ncbi:DUF4064 domain-containing protein [Macrococcus equipercicus]|uniref:DUF4064 domain-containing protein n=1 Tax=Macrococcus equipercicus TaxID=69967 RepID=A0ABQ6RBU1_9STAP|nr:DUF4064 domain-containing protein [Macrococcus equipercicus]KAA1042674.1 DUF4064 domain-containing protein [Macrococcus equipercicus]